MQVGACRFRDCRRRPRHGSARGGSGILLAFEPAARAGRTACGRARQSRLDAVALLGRREAEHGSRRKTSPLHGGVLEERALPGSAGRARRGAAPGSSGHVVGCAVPLRDRRELLDEQRVSLGGPTIARQRRRPGASSASRSRYVSASESGSSTMAAGSGAMPAAGRASSGRAMHRSRTGASPDGRRDVLDKVEQVARPTGCRRRRARAAARRRAASTTCGTPRPLVGRRRPRRRAAPQRRERARRHAAAAVCAEDIAQRPVRDPLAVGRQRPTSDRRLGRRPRRGTPARAATCRRPPRRECHSSDARAARDRCEDARSRSSSRSRPTNRESSRRGTAARRPSDRLSRQRGHRLRACPSARAARSAPPSTASPASACVSAPTRISPGAPPARAARRWRPRGRSRSRSCRPDDDLAALDTDPYLEPCAGSSWSRAPRSLPHLDRRANARGARRPRAPRAPRTRPSPRRR